MRQTEADVEILVYIPASCRASPGSTCRALRGHDARHIKLARAYESFAQQPVTRIDIASTPLQEQHGPNTSLATTSPATEAHRQLDTTAPPLGSALSMSFWSLSFDSVCDNVQSPRVSHAVNLAADGGPNPSAELLVSEIKPHTAKKHSYVSPDDYIPDSQPALPAAPKARRRRLTLDDDIEVASDADETRILESQDLDMNHSYGVVEDIEDTEDDDDDADVLKDAWAGSPDLSTIPAELDALEDSLLKDNLQGQPQLPQARQPLSQTSANSQQCSQNAQPIYHNNKEDRADHACHIPSSLPEEAGRVVASSTASSYEPLEPLREAENPPFVPVSLPKRRSTEQQHRYQHPLVDDIEDADQTDSASSFAGAAEPNGPAYSRDDKNLRIFSPEPPVGCHHLDAASLITERLAKLAQDLDLEHRFTKAAVREKNRVRLGPFDRGYWVLDTSGWPAGLRLRAWEFLAKYVSRGDAGWGVWCSRRSRDDQKLRLHCFEATAGHTYLLLYLASQRQILTTGAIWMDGSGSPAITIPPRKRRDDGNSGSSRPSSRPSSLSTSRVGSVL